MPGLKNKDMVACVMLRTSEHSVQDKLEEAVVPVVP